MRSIIFVPRRFAAQFVCFSLRSLISTANMYQWCRGVLGGAPVKPLRKFAFPILLFIQRKLLSSHKRRHFWSLVAHSAVNTPNLLPLCYQHKRVMSAKLTRSIHSSVYIFLSDCMSLDLCNFHLFSNEIKYETWILYREDDNREKRESGCVNYKLNTLRHTVKIAHCEEQTNLDQVELVVRGQPVKCKRWDCDQSTRNQNSSCILRRNVFKHSENGSLYCSHVTRYRRQAQPRSCEQQCQSTDALERVRVWELHHRRVVRHQW